MRPRLAGERPRDRGGAVAARDPEPEGRDGAVEWEGLSPYAGDEDGEEDTGSRLHRAACRPACELGGER